MSYTHAGKGLKEAISFPYICSNIANASLMKLLPDYFLLPLALGILLTSCGHQKLKQEIELQQAKMEVAAAKLEIEALRKEKPGLIHSVFVWLKADMPAELRASFVEDTKALGKIESVSDIFVGPHAETGERSIVDHSYDIAIIVQYKDLGGHDAYQIDPIHQDYLAKYRAYFEKLQIYDNLVN